MTDDIRYSELVFLNIIAKQAQHFFPTNEAQMKATGLQGHIFVEMVAALIEDLYIEFYNEETQLFVAKLRGELGPLYTPSPTRIPEHLWNNPRQAIRTLLGAMNGAQMIRVSYRGLRRIEELREILRNERVLEEFGVLLSDRYFLRDIKNELAKGSDIPVSALYIDMDKFKPINDKFGHAAGDLVMKKYLQAVRDSIEPMGTAYRGRGDEVKAFISGQGHDRAMGIAENVRQAVAKLDCEHAGEKLPRVTASIGVATAPPDARNADLETVAEGRNRKAKEAGRNCVIGK